jgi:Flp pilus assembly pilin Flp
VKADQLARGQIMTEYALILAAIAVVCIVGYNTIGTSISGVLVTLNGKL